MGSSKQTTATDQYQDTGPWRPTQDLLKQLLGNAQGLFGQANTSNAERNALTRLQGNIKYTNEYMPQMRGLLKDMFAGGGMGEGAAGIRSSWDTANTALTPIARGDFVDPTSNPYLQGILGKTQNDIYNRIGSSFAGAGRSFSGAHMNALGTGIGDATNSLYYNAYSGERDRQSNAIRDLISGGLGTYAGLDASAGNVLGARTHGANFAPPVTGMRDDPYLKQLELERMRRGLPLQNLGMLRDFILPIAGMGSTGHSATNSTTTSSSNPWQTAIGGALGGLGLFGGMGPFGAGGA